MSSTIGVPLDPGPMDVENSIPVATNNNNNNSSSTISSTMDTDRHDAANAQPEVAAGGGAAGGGNHPPLPPGVGGAAGVGVAVAANAVVAGDAPEERAEPSIPEVALVPLPPNFGEFVLLYHSPGSAVYSVYSLQRIVYVVMTDG